VFSSLFQLLSKKLSSPSQIESLKGIDWVFLISSLLGYSILDESSSHDIFMLRLIFTTQVKIMNVVIKRSSHTLKKVRVILIQ
jgi:hypothetical protein